MVSRKRIIPYNPKLKDAARELRKNSTLAEVILWQQIKGRQVEGYQFLRQRPIGNYVVDFFCYELMLAIEIDGETHNFKAENDQIRQNRLEALGIRILRFLDIDVKRNLEGVVQGIRKEIRRLEVNKHLDGEEQ